MRRLPKTPASPLPVILASLFPLFAVTAEIPEGYVLKWSDEFSYEGAPDPEKWTHETGGGGWGNAERQIYTDERANSRVEDGQLIIEVRQSEGTRSPVYTSARLITREKAQWQYGRMEVRARIPRTTGTWPAIWMLAADNLFSSSQWPDNGEIDIMEAVGYEQDPLFKEIIGDDRLENIHGTVHTLDRHGGNAIGGSTFLPDSSTAFHTYALNWTEDRLEFEVDGEIYHTHHKSDVISQRNPPEDISPFWPFDQRFFLILNVAVGGTWGGHFNTGLYPQSPYGADGIDEDGEWPQQMVVDYVRFYGPEEEPLETSPVPGTVEAAELDRSEGILIEVASGTPSPHTLSDIDAGDSAEFDLEVARAGTYSVTASVATPAGGASVSLSVADSGAATLPVLLPDTDGWANWESVALGELQLEAGINTLRLATDTGGFNLSSLTFASADSLTWKGWPVSATGDLDTGSSLGWINVSEDPWIWSYSLGSFIYPASAGTPEFSTGAQWLYIAR
ncbi:MAG: family 16 glycosylhydrolase [Oceanipulchritudo sp.]